MQRKGAVRTVLYIVPLEPLAAVGRVILKTLVALRSDRPESLISWRIFGVVRGLGMNWYIYGEKFMRCAVTGGTISVASRRSTRQARLWRGAGHAATRNMIARN
jgi:hypothetical protein